MAPYFCLKATPPIEPATETVSERPKDFSSHRVVPLSVTYLIAVLAGCAALMLQTVWCRQLALVLGSSTYAFSAMLFVVLAGIGFGSLVFNAVLMKYEDDALILIYVTTVSVIAAIVGIWLLPFVADCAGVAVPLRANYTVSALVCVAGSALVEFLPATAMGILFPLLVRVSAGSTFHTGRGVGNLYALNTLGTLVGSVVTSLWIIPQWGTHAAMTVAILLYSCVGAAIAMSTRVKLAGYLSVAVATFSVGYFFKSPDDPSRLNRGMFLYGYTRHDPFTASKVLFFKEGAACNVLVTQHDDKVSFRVNGKVDGSSDGDMAMQAGLAYLPRFLNPEASKVLVIGFGTGTTCGASLLFPATQVTCCEIEPAIVSASQYFSGVNHIPQDSSQFKIVYDDARAYVQGTTERFDLILSEPSNPWIAGVSNLFTDEFYKIASQKLASNGIFAQWIQTYSFTPSDYAMIVRTMSGVFPYQRLIRVSEGDTILLGSNEPLDRTRESIRASQRFVDNSPDVQSDLNRYFSETSVPNLLLTRMLLDERGLRTFVEGNDNVRRNLDRDLQLEFRAARHLYEEHGSDTGSALLGAAKPEWLIEHFERLQGEALDSKPLNQVVMLFLNAGHEPVASRLVQFGIAKMPDAPDLLATHLILSDQLDTAILDRLMALPDDSAGIHANRVGVAYWEKKQHTNAVSVFEGLCEKFPQSATSWTNLAINYEELGNTQQSDLAYRRAAELDSINEFTRRQAERRNQKKSPAASKP